MSRFFSYSLVFAVAFAVGVYSTFFYSSWMDRSDSSDSQVAESVTNTITAFEPIAPGDSAPSIPEESNCTDNWEDDPDDRPLVRKWSRGEWVKDADYCSGTAIEARGAYLGSSVRSKLVDLNGDGQDELSTRTLCSPTGNCSMTVYQRSKRGYRTIFTDIHGVQRFTLKGPRHFGYTDIWAWMHGSSSSGDLVVYRFNGKKYRPVACYEYEHEDRNHDGKANKKPTLTPYSNGRICE